MTPPKLFGLTVLTGAVNPKPWPLTVADVEDLLDQSRVRQLRIPPNEVHVVGVSTTVIRLHPE